MLIGTYLGGLGHLAVQFASKMGAEVFALSHSANKREEAKHLGATHFIDISKSDEVTAQAGKVLNLHFSILNVH